MTGANNDDEWDKHKLTSRDTVVSDRCYPDVIFAPTLLTKWNGYYHTTAQSELVNRSSKTKDLFVTSVIGWHHKCYFFKNSWSIRYMFFFFFFLVFVIYNNKIIKINIFSFIILFIVNIKILYFNYNLEYL